MVAHALQHQVQLAPEVFVAGYDALLDRNFLDSANIKVIVNCGLTDHFLQFLDLQQPVISTDVIVLNLDPNISQQEPAFKEFHLRFNRILQNYLAFFYSYNDNVKYFINSNYQNSKLTFDSPTMNGMPIIKLLFNINRLLKLIKNVNSMVGVVFVSKYYGHDHYSNGTLYALAILYLMDHYNYNFESGHRYVSSLLPQREENVPHSSNNSPQLFSFNRYEDVLLIDSLKKFYTENRKIKQEEAGVMTKNVKLKRSIDCLAPATTHVAKRLAWTIRKNKYTRQWIWLL